MTDKSGKDGDEREEHGRPGGDVAGEQVVDVDSSLEEKVKVMVAIAVMKTKVGMKRYQHHHGYLGGQDEVNEEEDDEDEEAKKWFVRKKGWTECHQATGDHLISMMTIMMTMALHWWRHLQETKQGGDSSDDEEEEEEPGPEPAKADRGEGGLDHGHGDQPDVLADGRDDGGVALGGGGEAVEVDGLPRVGDAQESQGEEAGENDPDDVGGNEDAAVADQVVLELVVAGKGGEGPQAKLEGEHHLWK